MLACPVWNSDEHFKSIMSKVHGITHGANRCYIIHRICLNISFLEGDVAEIGVSKGGTLKIIAESVSKNKTIYGFDTFEGMPDLFCDKDVSHKIGDFSDTSLERVAELLKDNKNVVLVKGIFPESSDIVSDKRFSFVHVDCDLYKSTLSSCEFFYERLVDGGIMLFDDYGFLKGARTAVDEFFKDKREKPIYFSENTGQCLVIKLKELG